MSSAQKKRYGWKQFLFDIHLWLGLGSGVIVSILCLTGVYLALHPPIEDWLNRDLRVHNAEGIHLSPAVIVDTASGPHEFTAREIPSQPNASWILKQGRRSFYVDPFTGELLGEPLPFLDGSFRFAFRLHRWLLLDTSVGRPITGAATVIFLVVLLSGGILWLQKTRKNRTRGLAFKRGVNWKRWNYDLHLILGVYALIPLFVMGASGLFWSYRTPFQQVAYTLLDGRSAPQQEQRARTAERDAPLVTDLPYEQTLRQLEKELSYSGSTTIYFPKADDEQFRVVKKREAGFWSVPARDEVQFDRETGDIVERKLFGDKTRAEKFLSLIKAIHIGEVLGNFSLVLYLLASLVGTTLPISGSIMWWNRIRAQRRGPRRVLL